MHIRDFIIENGIIYYRKKPLYRQPLFWTTLVGGLLTIVLGVTTFIFGAGFFASEVYSSYGEEPYYDYESPTGSYTEEFGIGETAEIASDVSLTVEKLEKDDSIELVDDTYGQPVLVQVTFQNQSDEDFYIDELFFALYDSDGYYSYVDLRTYDVNIPEKLAAGESTEMTLYFDSYDSDQYTLIYDDYYAWGQLFANSL